ncbi:PiggyBac transposable element-derived protein 4 [Eumeta japonica]|uniref:PiggyBac transposable element-derived protein 4 n=1 Tax=Eumeta variegata TaxID=151549 RepID=A0A4C1Z089_EUMVA|nr:PiggyBac transposable element-derived protein 4 [Eumeta japonica]
MGYNILPSLELYWSSDPAFRVDEIASTMPYRRFKLILRCLHLNDNSKQLRSSPDYDKLFKIRPLVTLLNSTFQNNANNSSSQSIDESMIVFKGSSTGYLYEFDIYTGKDGDRVEDNLGAKVVTKLTEKLTGMGAVHVTFDNFFCGYEIMKSLFDNCIYASGTVRRQRADLPKIVKSKKKLKLKKGEHKWRVKGDVAFVIWQDTKEVLFLTNAFHPNVNITSVTRTQKMVRRLMLDVLQL